MNQSSLDQLMELIKARKEKRNALEEAAAAQVTGQPWRTPREGQNTLEYMMGRGNSPAESRALNQLYGSILNRKPGQTAIGAASGGLELGSQLIDNIREKQKASNVEAAKIGVDGAGQDISDLIEARKLDRYEEANRISREKLALDRDKEAWDRAHPNMSVNTEKVYGEYNAQAIASTRAASKFDSLARQLETAGYLGGAATWTNEKLKQFLGTQDQQTALIEAGRNATVSEGIASLPPGVASDKDIELVMGTVPGQFSDPQYLANYVKARANVERLNAEYAEFVQAYMENNKDRNYSMVGVNSAWKFHKIPPAAKAYLQRNSDDPKVKQAFADKYGEAMLKRALPDG